MSMIEISVGCACGECENVGDVLGLENAETRSQTILGLGDSLSPAEYDWADFGHAVIF